MNRTDDRYLKSVDRHNQYTASAFIATSGMSLFLLDTSSIFHLNPPVSWNMIREGKEQQWLTTSQIRSSPRPEE